MSKTFAQLQQVRQYYQFSTHLDVDRYKIDGAVAGHRDRGPRARPTDQSSNSWYNNTLVFTHGYGVVAAYGNQRTANGEPKFLESDIPPKGSLGNYQPRIYFGEESPEYSIVGAAKGAKNVELDYPSAAVRRHDVGSERRDDHLHRQRRAEARQLPQASWSTRSSSSPGDPALQCRDRRLADPLRPRPDRPRVQKVAPYLTLDSDPYPAVVDGRVVWIVDGYTTTANYPYSRVEQLSSAIADTYTPAAGLRRSTTSTTSATR